jgi:hypothetical protein
MCRCGLAGLSATNRYDDFQHLMSTWWQLLTLQCCTGWGSLTCCSKQLQRDSFAVSPGMQVQVGLHLRHPRLLIDGPRALLLSPTAHIDRAADVPLY